MLNLQNGYSFLDKVYLQPAGLIMADHWALYCKKMLDVYLGQDSQDQLIAFLRVKSCMRMKS